MPDLDLLISVAEEAAQIAVPLANGRAEMWEKSGGAGPVTEADLAVNAMLEARLKAARPDYGWLSEETEDDPKRLQKPACFILDPIDGTRSFIAGEPSWAHSFATVQNGQVTAAVIYLPMLKRMYTATLGGGAKLNGEKIEVRTGRQMAVADILAARPALEPSHWSGGKVPPFHRHHRPSLAYRMALVAEGSFDGMITFRNTWEWDICAGALIASEAGAVVSDRRGDNLTFNGASAMTKGVIAAPKSLCDEILNRLNI